MEQLILDDGDRRRIESLNNPILFEELLELASEICFGEPLEYKAREKSFDPNAQLIAGLGLRGLRTALDVSGPGSGFEDDSFGGERSPEILGDNREYIWIDSPMRKIGGFDDQPDLEVIDKVRQFGEALLSDAYRVLGQDVFDKIKDYKNAHTDEEQVRIISWLDGRLADLVISEKGILESADGAETDNLYHPIRLAPRIIGVYPNHSLAPTCLGVSIIAASFLEQVGADHMHVGVMWSAKSHRLIKLANVTRQAAKLLEKSGEDVSGDMINTLLQSCVRSMGRFSRDQGYHAANLTKLKSGKWMQIDSNFDATTVIDFDDHNERLDHAYKDIDDFKSIAPGLERSVPLGTQTVTDGFIAMIDTMRPIGESQLEAITNILLHDDESIIEKIQSVFLQEYSTIDFNKLESMTSADVAEIIMVGSSREVFHDLFTKYVLWGDAIDVVQKRCRIDPEYLRRRISDLKNLLPLVIASAAIEFDNQLNGPDQGYAAHTLVEVGDPAHRIGFSVLSDIAQYLDNRLPPSFWLKNWNSLVPLTETMPQDMTSINAAELTLLKNLSVVYEKGNFSYAKTHDIIISFQTTLEEMEKAHGKD